MKVTVNLDSARLFSDTSLEAEAIMSKIYRQTPPWRKLEMVAQMNETVRLLALSGLRQRHPDADEDEIGRRYADIILGKDLAERAYGPLVVGDSNGS